jgi:hypothetical protein
MKIEIDLEKLRFDMQARKEIDPAFKTITVRHYGKQLYAHEEVPDEICIEQMKAEIKSEIYKLMLYAPDVSDIKPNEVRIEPDYFGRKIIAGDFYYASAIADYWISQQERAVIEAKRNSVENYKLDLCEELGELCNCDVADCWHHKVVEYIADKDNNANV